MLTTEQSKRTYRWPYNPLGPPEWISDPKDEARWRSMPESLRSVALDSRWPAFFPSPICLVTTGDGTTAALEKVVGASIVNRFPYIIALSFCRERLSERHYPRTEFCNELERDGVAAIQFLPVGTELDAVMGAIGSVPDHRVAERIAASGLQTRPATTNRAPVFEQAFMVYEAELVSPKTDHEGRPLFERPWLDVGSHRIYYLEIKAIQLRQDVASGRSQIRWRSLPEFSPLEALGTSTEGRVETGGYHKSYLPNYSFPANGTTAFDWDYTRDGMAVKQLDGSVVYDNDAARWPCFFPQSAGLITSTSAHGVHNVMPCGSTTIVSRHPLVIAPCVSYAAINERYAPRASLASIQQTRRFGCGVPFINDIVVDALRYAGNISLRDDPNKLRNLGLKFDSECSVPVLTELPVFFECEVVGSVHLGTHVMFFGEVKRIRVRNDVSVENPLEWCPWPDLDVVGQPESMPSARGLGPEG